MPPPRQQERPSAVSLARGAVLARPHSSFCPQVAGGENTTLANTDCEPQPWVLTVKLSSGSTAPGSRGCSGSPAGLCPGTILQGQLHTGSIWLPQRAKPRLQGSCSGCGLSCVCCALGLLLPAEGTALGCQRRQRSFSLSLTELGGWARKTGEGQGDSQSSCCWKDKEKGVASQQ